MDDPTSLLFGLESFRVVDVVRVADPVVQVVVETIEQQGICPDCGTASSRVKERPLVRVRDLPMADQQVALWWRKRRLTCQEPACPRAELPPLSRSAGYLAPVGSRVVPDGSG